MLAINSEGFNLSVREISDLIKTILDRLYKNDGDLIYKERSNNDADAELKDSELHVSERAVVFKFSEYFDCFVKHLWPDRERHRKLQRLKVDNEYNRYEREPKTAYLLNQKTFKKEEGGIVPDMIWHERGTDRHNLLAIEFKGWWNHRGRKRDEEKIEELCKKDGKYHYEFGATIEFGKTWETVVLSLYHKDSWVIRKNKEI